MRATFFSKSLNFFDSPTRSARSIMDIEATVARLWKRAEAPLSRYARLLCLRGFAAPAALVTVLLHLPRQVLGHQVDRVTHVRGTFARPEGHALQVKRGLGDLRVLDRRVALLPQLDLDRCQRGDLPRHLGELFVNPRPQLLVDSRAAAALHVDAHPPS